MISTVVQTNDNIQVIDISHNPIDEEGAKLLYESVYTHNESLKSFGDLSSNLLMGVRIKEEILQCLKVNEASKELKKA